MAQRRYQITKYRLSNVVNPDQLIMTFKHNIYETLDFDTTPTRANMPIFGVDTSFLANVTGWAENVQRFEMVEFLSGKLTLYVYNNIVDSVYLISGDNPYRAQRENPLFVGYYPYRNAISYSGNAVVESPPPLATSTPDMWAQTAEYPGYSIKIVNTTSSAKNIQKFRWKMSQKNFKSMKADPSNFQIETANIGTTGAIPANNSGVTVDFGRFVYPSPGSHTSLQMGCAVLLWSLSFTVRFKQKVVVNPV